MYDIRQNSANLLIYLSTVKNYSQIVRNAPQKIKARGKVVIQDAEFGGNAKNEGTLFTNEPFTGPSLMQRLLGWAAASRLVTVSVGNIIHSVTLQKPCLPLSDNNRNRPFSLPLGRSLANA